MLKIWKVLKFAFVVSIAVACLATAAAILTAPHFLGVVFITAGVIASIKVYTALAFVVAAVLKYFKRDTDAEVTKLEPASGPTA